MKLIDLKDWLEKADNARKSLLSFSIFFAAAALVVGAFILLFGQAQAWLVGFFVGVAAVYFILYKWSAAQGFYALAAAMLFYLGHSLAEFVLDMVPTRLTGSGDPKFGFAPFMLQVIPYVYMLLRIMLLLVFVRGLHTHYILKKHPRMVRYLQENTAGEL
jgi:hypothetical protein